MCEAEGMSLSDTVIVTGFGPFGNHSINASWEAVNLLPEEIGGCRIVKEEIPVCYKEVDKRIQELWTEHEPKLVLHVGVSDIARGFCIEAQAHPKGYVREDISGCIPVQSSTKTDVSVSKLFNGIVPKECSSEYISCQLDLDKICDAIDVNCCDGFSVEVSRNAGRYLCEYIYYKSLSIDSSRTVFVHVPPLGKPYSAHELAQGLAEIIRVGLAQCDCASAELIEAKN